MIRTHRLTKHFRKVTALRDFTLDVPEGAILALLGPNGAGKTTLIKTLLNIHAPDSGSATVLGVDSRRIGPDDLMRIGYVSENQSQPDWMTVGGFLRYCKPFYPGWDDALAARLISVLRLPVDRRLSEISRGMRMKAALVSALAYRPKLLTLDEPFSGLDVLVRDEISETILGEMESQTILLASHDLADLESFASHVAYMADGELLFAEEMPVLMARYRRVEVTLEDDREGSVRISKLNQRNYSNGPGLSVEDVTSLEAQFSKDWPAHWLSPEWSERVIRFTDANHDPEQVRGYFPSARSIHVEPLSLRSIFVALARQRRETHDLAHS
jgi:ABC-2 type transport system ATP-binding protein